MLRLPLIVLAIPTLALAQEPISHQAGRTLAQASFGEYLELLALPNDAINTTKSPVLSTIRCSGPVAGRSCVATSSN